MTVRIRISYGFRIINDDEKVDRVTFTEQITEGFQISIRQLIPSTRVTHVPPAEAESGFTEEERKHLQTPAGQIRKDAHTFWIWFTDIHESKRLFQIHRPKIPLSGEEERMIGTIPVLLENIKDIHSKEFLGFSFKFSSRISFGDLVIAKFLEKKASASLWNPISIIATLQELTFRRYEDQKCTSGFIFTDAPEAFIHHIDPDQFKFYRFDTDQRLNHSFFDTPPSFRYVDGRNSFYLIDDKRIVKGVLRLANPGRFSLVDRIGNRHLNDILSVLPGHNWISFVGLKDEVFVILGEHSQLKWAKNHWFLRDRSVVLGMLEQFGFAKALSDVFLSIVLSLSEMRMGSVILIADQENDLPPAVGKIDDTTLGKMLRDSIQSAGIADLQSCDALLGILTSDGLTSLSKQGRIIGCGDIIDITKASTIKTQGGGRSQAAVAASYYGLCIGISQDGPVSFYRKGKLLIRF